MKTEQLKAIQAPIKEKYKTAPEAALITLKAEGVVGEGITCSVNTGKAIAEAGLHAATGGDGLHLCSGDMMLEALVACAGVTLKAVATSLGIDIGKSTITAEGDIDFRGTLGVAKEISVGFLSIRLHFFLDGSLPNDQTELLKKLTERYCVVYQTLTRGVAVETTYHTR
ncbi:MAG TPA: OsmC family protein [Bacteroidia bacterium]|nr:OsmC family protein [Bacteroidia bacterium]